MEGLMFRVLFSPAFALWFCFIGFQPQEVRAANVVAISCGSTTSNGTFIADNYFLNGQSSTVTNSVDTSAVVNPAPQAVYRSNRFGNFSYTIPGLTVGSMYLLRLHFAETYWSAAGIRKFNVQINGNPVLTNFDIFAVAGGKNIANIQEFQGVADQDGKITIQFTTVMDNAEVSGIEISLISAPSSPSYNLKVSGDKQFYSVGDSANILVGLVGTPTNSDYDFYVGATFNGSPIGLSAITSQQSYAVTPALTSGTSVFVATVFLENTAKANALNQAIAFYNSDIVSLTAQLNGTSDPNTQATLQAKIAHDQNRLIAVRAEQISSRQQVGVPYLFNISAQ
jgi:hypothetical protein